MIICLRLLYGLFLVLLIGCSQNDMSLPPVSGWYYRAKKGESLREISARFGFEEEVLRRLNSLPAGKRFAGGELIFIPVGPGKKHTDLSHQAFSVKPTPTSQPKVSLKRTGTSKTSKITQKTDTSSSRKQISQKKYRENVSQSKEHSSKITTPKQRFIMPVEGKIIRKFSKGKNTHNYGIDISAAEGTPVKASRSGKVIYSDDVIPGFGNMVILDHNDGFTTLYAHNKKNLVEVNQFVKQGDKIALVGRTGNATESYLHFEIRYNAEPVDPMKYLTPASGKK